MIFVNKSIFACWMLALCLVSASRPVCGEEFVYEKSKTSRFIQTSTTLSLGVLGTFGAYRLLFSPENNKFRNSFCQKWQ